MLQNIKDSADGLVSDVAIVGAGAAGSMAAIALARRGISVSLIDARAKHPPEFRCEKLVDEQLQLIERLGLLDVLRPVATRVGQMLVVRSRGVREMVDTAEYGFNYQDFINSLRAHVPAEVRFINARVADIRNSEAKQTIVFANGETLTARLVVLATGLGHGLRQSLGMVRKTVHEQHSLCIGFSVRPANKGAFDFPALTYYSESLESRIAYVTLFPMGDVMRANLFTYHRYDDPFIADARRDPIATLYKAMPGLEKYLGRFQITDEVRIRMVDLDAVQNHNQHGVVLIGDAFQTSCPATGTGLTRCMNDVLRLSEHAPEWLAAAGMSSAKLASFYNDPLKTSLDARSAYAASYARKFATDSSLSWDLRRVKTDWRSRLNTAEAALRDLFGRAPRVSSSQI
jgi:2-polyprenyl-6-methoxyphenol hydroxylase-like FAD-dependent oxidoreductase